MEFLTEARECNSAKLVRSFEPRNTIKNQREKIMSRFTNILGSASVALLSLSAVAQAQERISLVMSSSHPERLPWIGMMSDVFKPEVDRILAESGNYEISWNESYGGQLYKPNGMLSAITDGITDIGWVLVPLFSADMHLNNVSYTTPFATDDPLMVAEIFNELNETVPALREEWEANNAVFLAATTVDTHHLFTTEPTNGIADIDGEKLLAAGAVGSFLEGTGAIAVNSALPSFYTDLQTGLAEGAVTITTVMAAGKIYEVSPYVTPLSFGSTYTGGVAINMDRWEDLPEEVQNALKTAGIVYSEALGTRMQAAGEGAMEAVLQNGGILHDWPEGERENWISGMPNIAQRWADAGEARGKPANEVLTAWMNALRSRGVVLARDWDKE